MLLEISGSGGARPDAQNMGDFNQRLELDLAMEGLFLRQLVATLEDYQRWAKAMARRPLPASEGDVREVRGSRRNDYAARQRETATWEAEVRALTNQTAKELDELLNIGFFVDKEWSTGLQGIEGFEAVFAERAMLRDKYIPETVFYLHAVYFESRDLFPE